jgi:hypothetical protein
LYIIFSIRDIEGTKPKQIDFKTTRNINPLQPVYNLPKTEEKPPSPPRVLPLFCFIYYVFFQFIRDSYNVDDIRGTRAVLSLSQRGTKRG